MGNKVFNFSKKYESIIDKIFSSDYRYYFDVDNKYVLKKLIITFFPFAFRGDWSNVTTSSTYNPMDLNDLNDIQDIGQNDDVNQSFKHMGFSTPRNNIHSPDLYIPLMSLITFILICCFSMGLENHTSEFDPAVVGSTLWKCVVILSLELIVLKIVFCFLDGNRMGTFDLLSHLNYRYTTLCTLMILNIIEGAYLTLCFSIYIFICQTIFVYKTLQRYTTHTQHSALELHSFGQKIIGVLALIQPFFSWILLKIIGQY